MARLIDLAAGRPWVTLLLAVCVILFGSYAAAGLNAELIPEIDFPMITVVTVYPGAGPDDVLEQVSKPLEAAIAGMPGLRNMQSTSATDLSMIVAEFAYGTDMKKAEATVAAKLRDATLPNGAQQPRVARIDPNSFPIVRLSVSGDNRSGELDALVRNRLLPALTAIEGVNSVEVTGDAIRRISVLVDPAKAKDKGVSVQQIASLLAANNVALPGGKVAIEGEDVPVRTVHTFMSLRDIENLVVGMTAGAPASPGGPAPAGTGPSGISGTPSTATPALPQPPSQAAVGNSERQPPQPQRRYVVKAGDSLSAIAARFGTTVKALAEANRIANPNLILAGATLAIPDSAAAAPVGGAATSPPTVAPSSASQQQYVVQSGDTLTAIASRSGTTVSAIAAANQLPNPNQIAAGSTLVIPAGRSSAAPQAAPSPTLPTAQPVSLKDVAEVREENADSAIVRTNGQDSIAVAVTKTQDANTVKVAQAVIAQARAIGEEWADRAEVAVVTDGSGVVQRSIDGLLREGAIGGLLAVLVVLAFLASLRGALTVAMSIPLSLLAAFLLMWWQGFTINIMTLGGLAVAIGRVVDDSIVVSESILRRVHAGVPLDAAVRSGAAEVASPITSSTLTTVGVFLPLGLVSGLAGQVFRPFALTVSFALLASLLCAVTVIPALARLVVRPLANGVAEGGGLLPATYTRILRWTLRHRSVALALAVLLFVGSLATIPLIPRSFLPTEQEKLLTITLTAPAGASAEWLPAKVRQMESVLGTTAGVTIYQATIGGRDDLSSLMAALGGQDPNNAIFLVRFADKVDLALKAEELQRALSALDDGGTVSIAGQQSAANTRLQVFVSGDDGDRVAEAADTVRRAMQGVPGITNVASDAATKKRELAVTVDPNKALEQGLTTAQVAMQVRQMFAAQAVTHVRLASGDQIELRLGLAPGAVAKIDDLRNLPFGAPNAQPLSSIADVQQVERPTRVTRINQRPGVSITGDIVAQNTGEVADAVHKQLAALALPPDVRVSYSGAISEMEDSFAQMYLALALAVVAVFAIMALFFSSLVEPLVILASLPLAAIGALFALLLTHRALGLPALIGLLMLIGIVVTNAIVLVDLAKRLRDEGRPVDEALLTAGRIRLRPVLMTALATLLALGPLALGFNEGAIIASELATVVIGGLLTSTLLTLIVVPVAYSLVRRGAARH